MNIKRPLSALLATVLLATAGASVASCTSPTPDPAGETATATQPSGTESDTLSTESPDTDPAAETESGTEPETEEETFEITFPTEEPQDVTGDGSLYTPVSGVIALKTGADYAFCDLTMTREAVPARTVEQSVYADAAALATLFGLTCTENTDTRLTMQGEGLSLTFTLRSNRMTAGENEYAFPTVIRENGQLLICADRLAGMLGYTAVIRDGTLYLAADGTLITEEKMNAMEDWYELYEKTVFDHSDVECDMTGVGKYDSVDPSERLVGMAYSTWHWKNRGWGDGYTWDLPLIGPYESLDADVVYQHGIWLRDAGVDFVFVDWSNNTCYDPATMDRIDFRTIEQGTDLLFEVWSKIPDAPKICIFVGPGHSGQENVDNGNHQKKVDQVYRDYVEKYPDMYFCYDGKPLLICYGATPTQYGVRPAWTDDRFTVRWMTGYVGQQDSLFSPATMASRTYWSWEERGTQTYCIKGREVEAVTVTAASRQQGEKEGDPGWIPAYGRQNGLTLKKQFQRAIELGSRFVIVVSWNEWVLGEQNSPEFSKDIEPSQLYGTFYLDLLTELIKKYKGQL